MGNGGSKEDSLPSEEFHQDANNGDIFHNNVTLKQHQPQNSRVISPTKGNAIITNSATSTPSTSVVTTTSSSPINNNNNVGHQTRSSNLPNDSRPTTPAPTPTPTPTCTPNSKRLNRKRTGTIETNKSNKSLGSLSTMTRSIGSNVSGTTTKINNRMKSKNALTSASTIMNSHDKNKYPSTSFYSNKHKKSSTNVTMKSKSSFSSSSAPSTSSHLEAVLLRRKRKAQMQHEKQMQRIKEQNSGKNKRNLYANARNDDMESSLVKMTTPKDNSDETSVPLHKAKKDTEEALAKQDEKEKNTESNTNNSNKNTKEKSRSRQLTSSSIFSVLSGGGNKDKTDTNETGDPILTNPDEINIFQNDHHNNNDHHDISYDDDNESSLTSNLSLNTSTMSQSTNTTQRSMTADAKAHKKKMKEDELRHRIKRLTKSDKKKKKELAMRDKLHQLKHKDSPSTTNHTRAGSIGTGESMTSDSYVATTDGEEGGSTPTRNLSYYRQNHDIHDEEEKQEITKDLSPYEVRQVYDSVIAESNLVGGNGKRSFIQHLSEKFESLLPPNEVDVKNPGKFPEKPNDNSPSSPELLEHNMYSSFLNDDKKPKGESNVDDADEQSAVSSVSQFFEEDQLL